MNTLDILNTSIKAALNAGKAILDIYYSGDFDVQIKSDNSPLTKADRLSHQIIDNILSETKLPILSEEGSDIGFESRKDWKKFWMIDPIDGTKEFIKRNNEFTVNIALIENNKPTLGVVYAPAIGELYFAEENLGAFKVENILDFETFEDSKKIDLTQSNLPDKYTIVVSRSHMNNLTQKFVEGKEKYFGEIVTKSYGSSLKICKVAERSAHCYPRFGPTMEWDTAAAHCIAIFAGCTFTNAYSQKPIAYNKENLLNPYFVVESH